MKVKIVMDSREAAAHPETVERLKEEFDVEIKVLASGDFVPSSRCGIENKTVSGIIGDWKDKRLKTQMMRLKEQFDKPILLVNGSLAQIEDQSSIPIQNYITSFLDLWLNHGIATFFISDRHLIPFLSAATRLEAGLVQQSISIREYKKKAFTDKQVALRVLEGFDNVSGRRAVELLEYGGSILHLITMDQKMFYQIPRLPFTVGPSIQRICTTDFRTTKIQTGA